ncbi:hypothetical protein [Rhodoblastus sp.]|uniref:hypothetical protein n=1 Tax=Rhodoblastus sp. TaxID=1962975 RepID=UPI002634C6D1|nr:hypothetical protein [Rhodoblastus sp.]
MSKRILAIGAALVFAIGSAGPTSAMRRLTVHPRSGVPLPFFVTSSHYWLYAGPVRTRHRVTGNYDYVRLVAEPVGNIVPVGPDLGFEW